MKTFMNRPQEPATGSTSTPRPQTILPQHSHKVLFAAATLITTASALPLSNVLSGGYLTSPPSRNYIAYETGSILPSASHPLNLLPEIEPTPHSLKSSQHYVGGTCGSADGVRNYDSPLSRLHTLLPLDVQNSFEAGGEIEVSVSLYGLDAGGHFEFHLCPLDYPEVPSADCFDKYPLTLVKDVNYGSVRDENYPERVYLPLPAAFGGMQVVVDERENPAGVDMMEFRYVLKLPDDEALVTYLNENGVADAGMSSNSQGLQSSNQAETTTSSFGDIVANSQGVNSQGENSDESLASQFSQSSGVLHHGNRFTLRRRRQQSVTTPITGLKDRVQNPLPFTNLSVSGSGEQQWYATQNDNGYTVSSVATVPISSIVTDGNGTTTITTLQGTTVLTGGAKVPASMTTTWGDASIYGNGIDLHVDRPPPVTEAPQVTLPETTTSSSSTTTTATDAPTTTTSEPEATWPVNNVKPMTPEQQQEPVQVSASIPPSSKPGNKSTKYVLLRWHYQTSLDCYPQGYEKYSWPSEWGNWTAPWAGECNDTSTQDHYWNCAEIQILSRTSPIQEEMVTNSESKPALQQNEAPQAMPDMILIGKNELAHLNVLANDTDPNRDALHLMEVTEAQHGYVALLDGKKELIYAPNQDFEGLDSFEYTVCDAYGECDTAKIDVMVGSNSDLIFAKDDRAETTGTDSVVVDVTANDVLQRAGQSIVRSSDPLIITDVSGTRRGYCHVTSDNQVEYAASEAFVESQGSEGQDRCRYTVCLGESSEVCDEGWLTIKILPSEVDTSEEESDADLLQDEDNVGSIQEDEDNVGSIQEDEDMDVDQPEEDKEDQEVPQEVDTPDSLHTDLDGGDMQVLVSNIGSDGSGDVLAIDDNVVTDAHDEPFIIDVLANDEYTGTPYLTEVTNATSGKCSLTDDNQVSYTPTPGFVGWDRCQYTVCVEDDVCDEGRIKIQVMILPQDTSLSSNIVTTTDKVTVETGKPLVVDVASNDVALGTSRPLTVTGASPALHGGCTVTDDNKIEYISDAGFTGWDRCQYTVCLGNTCNVGQIGIKVMPQGSAPVDEISPGALQANSEEVSGFSISIAKPDAVTVEAGTTTYLDVLENDIKPDDQGWAIESVTHPNFGDAQIVFGRVEYTPVEGFVGLDSFDYTVCDEVGNCDTASVVVTVVSNISSSQGDNSGGNLYLNQAIVEDTSSAEVFAEDDEATVTASEFVVVDVTANDRTTGDNPLVVSSVSKAIRGACVVTSDDKIRYTAPEGFSGLDRCTYSVCAASECDKGRIEFTVLPSSENIASSAEIESLPAASINIVAPIDDEDESTPMHEADENDISPSDENKQSSSSFGGLTIMSESVNVESELVRMHADDDSIITSQNVEVLVDVTANDFVEGMADLIITHAGGSQHGDCVIEGKQIRYIPQADFVGQDRCGYIVCRQDSNCAEGIVRIKVISDSSALKHEKTSVSPVSSIGSTRSSSVQLCSLAALNHEIRRLRGYSSGTATQSFVGKTRHLEADIQSSCVGQSLVTTTVTPTQTITYTSTYHGKNTGSASSRSIDLQSKIRSASRAQVEKSFIDTDISLSASADATLIPGFPDQNFGSAPSMLVSSASSKSGRHDALLKFDTSSVDTSVCSDGILDAKVTIYSMASSSQGGTFLTTPSSMRWTESDVTWNNAPNSNGIILNSLGQVQGKTYYDIDVSAALVLGQPLSIHILPGTSSDVSAQYATRNHSDSSLHPVLRIKCVSFDGPQLDQ